MTKNNLQQFAADPLAFFQALTIPSVHGPKLFGECMADFQRDRFAGIAPALIAVANGTKPPIGKYWWEATKGASKDSDLACCLLWLLAFAKRPLTCQIGAADLLQADEMRKAAKDILRLTSFLAPRIEIQSWKIICKATDSVCDVLASDASGGAHGSRPSVCLINELSHIAKQEFAETLADNATKMPNGLFIVATNSGHIGTYQDKWRQIALTSDRWLMNCYSQPAPWLDEADILEAKRRNSTSRWKRLYYGIWAAGGDALDSDDIQAAINPQLFPGTIRQGADEFMVGGLDLGIRHDHSGFIILAGDRSTLRFRLVHAQSWKPDADGKVNLMEVERAVLEAHQRYGLVVCGADPFQAELMIQRLSQQDVPMEPVNFVGKNLDRMASTLLDIFRSRRIELFPHPQLIDDLGRLVIEERSYGHRLTATRTESGHADIATALAIALPLAVDAAGEIPIVLGVMIGEGACESGLTPFQQRQREYQEEMEALSRPEDDQAPFRELMWRAGRTDSPFQ